MRTASAIFAVHPRVLSEAEDSDSPARFRRDGAGQLGVTAPRAAAKGSLTAETSKPFTIDGDILTRRLLDA
jgi:hypothetical protein